MGANMTSQVMVHKQLTNSQIKCLNVTAQMYEAN